MSGNLAPLPIWQFLDANGHPIAGGSVTYYQAGTQNKVTIYSDIALDVPLPNPITLDSAGRPSTGSGPTPIWFDPSRAYKQVVLDAQGDVIWTADNIVSPGTGQPGPQGPPGAGMLNGNYTEGDWTPYLASSVTGSAGTGTTYAEQSGHWTRIGRAVFVTGHLRVSHLGTYNDDILMIAGVPFPIADPNTDDRGGITMTSFYNIGAIAPTASDWASVSGTAYSVEPQGFILGGFYRPFNLNEFIREAHLTDATYVAFHGFYLTASSGANDRPAGAEEIIISDPTTSAIELNSNFSSHIVNVDTPGLTLWSTHSSPGSAQAGDRLIIIDRFNGPTFLHPDDLDVSPYPGAFYNEITSAPTPLNGGIAEYVFSSDFGNRWRLVSHRQHYPVEVRPWDASWYGLIQPTPSYWLVEPGHVIRQAYELVGNKIRFWLEIVASTFAGNGAVLLINRGAWGTFLPRFGSQNAGVVTMLDGDVNSPSWGNPETWCVGFAQVYDNDNVSISNITRPFHGPNLSLNCALEFEVQ